MKTQNFVDSNGLDTTDYTYWHLNVNKRAFLGALWCPCVNCVQRKGSTVATAHDHCPTVSSGHACLTPDCLETE